MADLIRRNKKAILANLLLGAGFGAFYTGVENFGRIQKALASTLSEPDKLKQELKRKVESQLFSTDSERQQQQQAVPSPLAAAVEPTSL